MLLDGVGRGRKRAKEQPDRPTEVPRPLASLSPTGGSEVWRLTSVPETPEKGTGGLAVWADGSPPDSPKVAGRVGLQGKLALWEVNPLGAQGPQGGAGQQAGGKATHARGQGDRETEGPGRARGPPPNQTPAFPVTAPAHTRSPNRAGPSAHALSCNFLSSFKTETRCSLPMGLRAEAPLGRGASPRVTPFSSRRGPPLLPLPLLERQLEPCSEEGWRPTFLNKAVICPGTTLARPLPKSSGKGNLWKRSRWVIDFSVNMMSERKNEVITSNALQLRLRVPLPQPQRHVPI